MLVLVQVYPAVVKTVGDDLKAINYTLAVGAVTSKILFNMLSENGPPCPDALVQFYPVS